MCAAHDVLHELLAGNERHTEELPEDYFRAVQDGQHPDIVSVCCSDSRVPQERMWGVDHPGTVFTPSNIGNQVWDDDEGTRIVDGGVLYPIHHAGTDVAVVVGHTGCGAVTAAYQVAMGAELPGPRGVDKWVELLVPVIEEALESETVDTEADEQTVINQLVEYNVDHQASFLRDASAVPDDVDVYGFVYDFQGIYGNEHGRAYLVNVNGETDPDRIAAEIPDAYEDATRSLLF
ncbi:carbonic anhydrase [Natronorubrum sp. JWXQ-INN-674]|uniref:carbonic anhydrase n=1 Tax=Natronorubrum halalkaliphilum TaxID=2691917 RepID=A0A6B0VP45_9EURY|nr:carbonic anhydrase [Natronorubrum halalkaliphilum]MXV63284.1 carbonic anhydrase [Natronorubrum halalkaliphilum]